MHITRFCFFAIHMFNSNIGIGVQGLADAFILMRYPFESKDANELNVQIFETLYYGALEASCEIAAEKGPYESYKGSPISSGVSRGFEKKTIYILYVIIIYWLQKYTVYVIWLFVVDFAIRHVECEANKFMGLGRVKDKNCEARIAQFFVNSSDVGCIYGTSLGNY